MEARGHAAAVERSVVEDEQAVGAQRPGQHGVGRALDVVGGYDPREVPPACGVVAAGFAAAAPGPACVSPTAVAAGAIIASGPWVARLAIGISMAAQSEKNGPMTAITLGSSANARALAAQRTSFGGPRGATSESSQAW